MVSTSIRLDAGRLSGLIGLGYEAGFDAAAWRAFGEQAAAAFGCQLAMVEYQDQGNPQTSFIATGGLSGFEEAFTTSRSRRDDDNYLFAIRDQPAGTVRLGSEVVAPDAMHQSDTYSRLAMPWQLEHFLFGAITTGSGIDAFFSLGRTGREAPFVEGDKVLISEMVLSHLRRSLTLRGEMASIRSTNALLSAAILHAGEHGNLPGVLNSVYGLSRAEAGLCQALIQGKTLLEASKTLDISRNTAKTHLARVFDKTGVHSQAGLLRLLALSGS
jgi:DNA-binding CsgD family transcriptional regulator